MMELPMSNRDIIAATHKYRVFKLGSRVAGFVLCCFLITVHL